MKNQIPKILIFSRLVIGFLIVILSYINIENYKPIAICLLTIGLLTDIFDGIIARKLNISTQLLRRLDSTIDQIFFICVAFATYIQCPEFFKNNILLVSILIGTEILTYAVSFFKFKKEIATHSLGAKLWTLLLFGTLIQVIVECQSVYLFQMCFWVGMITRIEIIGIILTLKKWTNDVPSLYHAVQLRKGREIKRRKLFNG